MKEVLNILGALYEEYETLILKRDQLKKESGSICVAYLKEFGALITERFQLQISCVREKKEIAYITQAINAGRDLNVDEMKRQIDAQMSAYQEQLNDLLKRAEESLQAKTSTEYTVRKVKQIYRQIARLIHPDVYPAAEENEVIRDLWERTEEAYFANDLKELSELLVLVKKALDGEHIPPVSMTVEDLEKKVAELKDELHTIRTTDPYCYHELLEDRKLVEEKKNEMKQEIADYEKYLGELKEASAKLLQESGIRMSWRFDAF